MKRTILSLLGTLFLSAVLTACGGGGSDSPAPTPEPTPAPEPSAGAGDFELVAGTLDAGTLNFFAPAGAPRCQSGPAIGADISTILPNGGFSPNRDIYTTTVGNNGHIYWVRTDCGNGGPNLVEVNPSTGQMQVQPIPFIPTPMAIASDGSVLLAFSGSASLPSPAGIWLFKNGVLSKLAGLDRAVPITGEYQIPSPCGGLQGGNCPITGYLYGFGEDGKGGEATFSYDFGMCPGPNDTFYILESAVETPGTVSSAYRRLSLDGTVKTIGLAPSPSLMCAANRRVLVSDGTTYSDLISGQPFGKEVPDPPDNHFYSRSVPYYFGDGLTFDIKEGRADGSSFPTLFIDDMKHGIRSAPWIIPMCVSESDCLGRRPDAYYQLDTMPYRMPVLPEVVAVDDNNYAYLRIGNALLRYKLPGKVKFN